MSLLISKILQNIATRIIFIIYMIIIAMSSFFLISGYYNQLELEEQKEYNKLKAIVASTVINIDGDEYETLLDHNPYKGDIFYIRENRTYSRIHELLKEVVEENGLKTPMYTINYSPKRDIVFYGVRSDSLIDYRTEYVEYPTIILEQFTKGGVIPHYSTENGTWISAFAPIKNRDGRVVGLLEADTEFGSFISNVRTKYLKRAAINLSVIIIITIMLVLYTGRILRQETLQKQRIMEQQKVIESRNKDITDSITYAKRIQEAIMPSLDEVKKYLKDVFVYYRPKDIVAGDFFWLQNVNDIVYYAAADCTGHGVPGAMVSVICENALNRALKEYGLTSPADILNRVRELIIEKFDHGDFEIKDGMDIALCSIDFGKLELEFAGANNPICIIRKGELIEIKGDRQAIGVNPVKKSFTKHQFKLEKGDSLYMFTDGFPDQFGGPDNKKFKYTPFKRLLMSIQDKSMGEQRGILDQSFNSWKGELEQVDDVCVIGVKI